MPNTDSLKENNDAYAFFTRNAFTQSLSMSLYAMHEERIRGDALFTLEMPLFKEFLAKKFPDRLPEYNYKEGFETILFVAKEEFNQLHASATPIGKASLPKTTFLPQLSGYPKTWGYILEKNYERAMKTFVDEYSAKMGLTDPLLQRLKYGNWVLGLTSAAIAGWEIGKSNDMLHETFHQGALAVGGFITSLEAGALALGPCAWVGVAAPVCVAGAAFAGGIIGTEFADKFFQSINDKTLANLIFSEAHAATSDSKNTQQGNIRINIGNIKHNYQENIFGPDLLNTMKLSGDNWDKFIQNLTPSVRKKIHSHGTSTDKALLNAIDDTYSSIENVDVKEWQKTKFEVEMQRQQTFERAKKYYEYAMLFNSGSQTLPKLGLPKIGEILGKASSFATASTGFLAIGSGNYVAGSDLILKGFGGLIDGDEDNSSQMIYEAIINLTQRMENLFEHLFNLLAKYDHNKYVYLMTEFYHASYERQLIRNDLHHLVKQVTFDNSMLRSGIDFGLAKQDQDKLSAAAKFGKNKPRKINSMTKKEYEDILGGLYQLTENAFASYINGQKVYDSEKKNHPGAKYAIDDIVNLFSKGEIYGYLVAYYAHRRWGSDKRTLVFNPLFWLKAMDEQFIRLLRAPFHVCFPNMIYVHEIIEQGKNERMVYSALQADSSKLFEDLYSESFTAIEQAESVDVYSSNLQGISDGDYNKTDRFKNMLIPVDNAENFDRTVFNFIYPDGINVPGISDVILALEYAKLGKISIRWSDNRWRHSMLEMALYKQLPRENCTPYPYPDINFIYNNGKSISITEANTDTKIEGSNGFSTMNFKTHGCIGTGSYDFFPKLRFNKEHEKYLQSKKGFDGRVCLTKASSIDSNTHQELIDHANNFRRAEIQEKANFITNNIDVWEEKLVYNVIKMIQSCFALGFPQAICDNIPQFLFNASAIQSAFTQDLSQIQHYTKPLPKKSHIISQPGHVFIKSNIILSNMSDPNFNEERLSLEYKSGVILYEQSFYNITLISENFECFNFDSCPASYQGPNPILMKTHCYYSGNSFLFYGNTNGSIWQWQKISDRMMKLTESSFDFSSKEFIHPGWAEITTRPQTKKDTIYTLKLHDFYKHINSSKAHTHFTLYHAHYIPAKNAHEIARINQAPHNTKEFSQLVAYINQLSAEHSHLPSRLGLACMMSVVGQYPVFSFWDFKQLLINSKQEMMDYIASPKKNLFNPVMEKVQGVVDYLEAYEKELKAIPNLEEQCRALSPSPEISTDVQLILQSIMQQLQAVNAELKEVKKELNEFKSVVEAADIFDVAYFMQHGNCIADSADTATCYHPGNQKGYIKLHALVQKPWESINPQVNQCAWKDGVKFCEGDEIEYIEYGAEVIEPQAFPTHSHLLNTAMVGACSSAIPEAIGDILHLNNVVSERKAQEIKWVINIALMLYLNGKMGLLSLVIAQAFLHALTRLGLSESHARVATNTANFFINTAMHSNPSAGIALTVTHWAAGKIGLFAEKKAMQMLSSNINIDTHNSFLGV